MNLRSLVAAIVVTGAIAGALPSAAQRGGGGGGGGEADAPMAIELGRLETLAQGFGMQKDQKSKVKAILDDAHKAAQPIRDQLASTRAAIPAAIQAGKPQPDIDAAAGAYGAQVAAMTLAETKALSAVLLTLTPEQRANTTATQAAFFMFRGIFLDNKKWDIIPDGSYGY